MEKREIEFYTWADRLASKVAERKVKEHVGHGMWTPSGFLHIGNARAELLTTGLISRALEDRKVPVKCNFIIDDFDDLDAIPRGVKVDEKEFKGYFGKPLREVPSPEKGHDSWADHFRSEAEGMIERLGMDIGIISSYDSYHKGLYDEYIGVVLDKAEKVRDIWNRITGAKKPKDWYGVMIRCEKCGRSATTRIISWDGKHAGYRCDVKREYVSGCGNEGKIKPEKGNAKLPWRLHWAAGWSVYGVTFESGGKDHYTPGGSADTGKAFAKEIFGREPPLLTGTEFIQIAGKKMSGSVGNVISLKDWLEASTPELLRFLMVSYKPGTVIDIDFGNAFLLLNDRYDRAERIYHGEKSGNEKKDEQMKRQYALSQTGEAPEKMPTQVPLGLASLVSQTVPGVDEGIEVLKKLGQVGKVDGEDRKRIEGRLEKAKAWSERAPDEFRVRFTDKPPKLEERQKEYLKGIAGIIRKEKEDAVENSIYELIKEKDWKSPDVFSAAYLALLGKRRGPKLINLIEVFGKEKVAERFESV